MSPTCSLPCGFLREKNSDFETRPPLDVTGSHYDEVKKDIRAQKNQKEKRKRYTRLLHRLSWVVDRNPAVLYVHS